MAIERSEPLGTRIVRFLAFGVGLVVAIVALQATAKEIADPLSALRRWRDPKTSPEVIARGVLVADGDGGLPPLCRVSWEHWERCGKNSCWREKEAMTTTQGSLAVHASSSPLPARVRLSSSWKYEPLMAPPETVDLTSRRADTWRSMARTANLGFPAPPLALDGNHRIRERCLSETEVTIQGCTRNVGDAVEITSCAGQGGFAVVPGSTAEPAIDDAANDVAWLVALAFVGLLAATAAVIPRKGLLADGLAFRAGLPLRTLGAAWAAVTLPVVALFVNLLFHGMPWTSTYATGRGGYVLGIAALTVWGLVARKLLLRRDTLRAALRPVLETPRSPLAQANGTAELSVRARARDGGVEPVLDGAKVAFSEAKIVETYQVGKNTSQVDRGVFRPVEDLEVTDESGEGVLHLGDAILDVETRTQTFDELPPRIASSYFKVERHENHRNYVITEKIIRDGEPLYVLGEVSALALRADESGYRAVRGSPTLGQAPGATGTGSPVIVYAGDERGLVESLASEARRVELLSVVAFGAAGILSAALLYVALL